jgi:hypothetical protein
MSVMHILLSLKRRTPKQQLGTHIRLRMRSGSVKAGIGKAESSIPDSDVIESKQNNRYCGLKPFKPGQSGNSRPPTPYRSRGRLELLSCVLETTWFQSKSLHRRLWKRTIRLNFLIGSHKGRNNRLSLGGVFFGYVHRRSALADRPLMAQLLRGQLDRLPFAKYGMREGSFPRQ